MGYQALSNVTTGAKNTAFGFTAGNGATSTVSDNTAVGLAALTVISSGSQNTAIGSCALVVNATGSSSTAVGYLALKDADGVINTAVGAYAAYKTTSGTGNTAIGVSSMDGNTTGNNSTAVGFQSLYCSITGVCNVAVGFRAYCQGCGNFNTAIGTCALNTNNCNDNTAVGMKAGFTATGCGNTFVGSGVGCLMTTGNQNTIIGRYTGNMCSLDIRTCSNVIVLADGAGCPRMYYKDQWCIPNDKKLNLTTSTGTTGGIRIQNRSNNTNANAIEFYGWNGTKTGSISTFVNTTTYSTSSDYRLKENVTCINNATNVVTQLNPVAFSWVHQASDTPTINGFLAHEVQALIPEAVVGEKDAMTVDDDGNEVPDYQGIDQSKLVPILTAALKEAITRIETLEAKVTALENT
jgi:hypothetical protein